MENSCKNCKFWDKREHDRVLHLGRCTRAQMIWDVTEWDEDLYETSEYSRVLKEEFKDEKHFVNDGSDFKAVLLTKENFSCNQFEKMKNKDFHWVCNECDFPNLTGAVPEEDIKLGRHSCVMCGCVEMHKEEIGFKRCLLCEWSACENHNECLSSKNK